MKNGILYATNVRNVLIVADLQEANDFRYIQQLKNGAVGQYSICRDAPTKTLDVDQPR